MSIGVTPRCYTSARACVVTNQQGTTIMQRTLQRTFSSLLAIAACATTLGTSADASAAEVFRPSVDVADVLADAFEHVDAQRGSASFERSLLRAKSPEAPDGAPIKVEASSAVGLEGKININTASSSQWQLLPGVGPAIAGRILAYREKRPFRDPLHLLRVKGIGRKTFAKMRPYLSVKGETTLQRSR